MTTRYHWPRFKLIHLVVLVAVLALVFAIWPAGISSVVAVAVVFLAIGSSITDHRPTILDWLVLAAIVFVLVALALPTVTPNHSARNRARKPAITPVAAPPPLQSP